MVILVSQCENSFDFGLLGLIPIFPDATLQKNNEISNKNNLLGLRKDRKKLEKERTIINERL